MTKEEAIEVLSDLRAEFSIWGDEKENMRYHSLSWAIKAMWKEPDNDDVLEAEE